jgi:hypothetical protein
MTTPDGKELELVIKPIVTTNGVANRAKVNQMEVSQEFVMPMVNEFPDVFSELPGMPPD